MTWATGRSRRRAGPRAFTLLEICFVLFIVALVFGASVPALSGWLAEQRLRGPAGELELLARTARLSAIARQRPCEVVIRPGALFLTAALDARPAPGDGPGGNAGGDDADALPGGPDPYRFSADAVTVLTQPWGEAALANRPETRWRFLPNGLCEPFHVRFVGGASRIDLTFDPLTATVSEETYEFQ